MAWRRLPSLSGLFVDGTAAGEVIFFTNDTRYWSTLGYTLWALNGETADPFTSRHVKCNKIAGSARAGYGLVFCHYASGDAAVGETMLAVLINAAGEYIVGEVTDDTFTQLFPWTESDNLYHGYNKGNVVRVDWDSAESLFNLYFNGILETTFTDEEAPLHEGGANGYMVVISPEDQFPDESVPCNFYRAII